MWQISALACRNYHLWKQGKWWRKTLLSILGLKNANLDIQCRFHKLRHGAVSPYSTHGVVCWQIYSQCQYVSCLFIKLRYCTESVRSDAANSWHGIASLQTSWPESLPHLCLTHPLHFPHWFSHQLCQHMARICIMVLFTRRVLCDAVGVTLSECICNLESARISC